MPAKRTLVFPGGTPARSSPAKKAKISAGKRKRKTGAGKGLGKALLKLAEQKRFTSTFSTGMNGTVSGNGTWYGPVNILAGIVTGSTGSTRNGDEIYINHIDVKISYTRPTDRPNTLFRAAVIRTDYDGIPTLGAAGAGPPLRASIGNNNVMSSLEEEKLIIEKEWYANPSDVGSVPNSSNPIAEIMDVKYVRVPVNRKVHYKDASRTSGVNCFSIIVTAQDRRGGATDTVGSCWMEYSIYFKDV